MLPLREACFLKTIFKKFGIGGVIPWSFFDTYRKKRIACKLSQYGYFSKSFIMEDLSKVRFIGRNIIMLTSSGAQEAENYYKFLWYIGLDKKLFWQIGSVAIAIIIFVTTQFI